MNKVCIVFWNDSMSHDGWVPKDECVIENMRCVSVGWVIEADDSITVVPHRANNDMVTGAITIPHDAVERVQRIDNIDHREWCDWLDHDH